MTLGELKQLNQSVAMQSPPAGTRKKLEGKTIHFVAHIPDYSAQDNEVQESGTDLSEMSKRDAPLKNGSKDEYFRISANEALEGSRNTIFDLRPKVADHSVRLSDYQLNELVKAEVPAARTPSVQAKESIDPLSTKTLSSAAPAASLAFAIGSNLVDPDAAFINRLIQRQAKLGPQIILFADVDSAMRSSSTCVQVGIELSAKTGKRILIVDSDTTAQTLSQRVMAAPTRGLTDLVRGDVQFAGTPQGTEKQDVAFMSAGMKPFDFHQSNEMTRENAEKLIGAIRNDFDFICVSMGTAFDSSLRMWGKNCDMTFLTIDPTCTSRSLAKAAVAELQNFGARVEGCITTIAEHD